MPTQGGGKPAPRKKPAGPTKAAALKKLGLTQADLDTLTVLASIRDATSSDDERSQVEALLGHSIHTETEPASQIHEASAHVTPGPGLGGQDPQAALEDRGAPKSELPDNWPAATSTEEPVWFMRNLRGVDVGFRLTRQQKQGEKRTNLKPRGVRGDMVRLESGDLKDPELQTQVSFGLVEVIPEGEALEAIKKQYTNAQSQVPAHIAMLRNPKGEEYEQANPVNFASDEEAYGIKVADLDPALMQGRLSDKEIKRDGGFVQNAQRTPTGGNPAIISDGFMAPAQGDGQLGSNDERSQQVDALARSKEFEGPGAGLGEVTVKIEPVRRVR